MEREGENINSLNYYGYSNFKDFLKKNKILFLENSFKKYDLNDLETLELLKNNEIEELCDDINIKLRDRIKVRKAIKRLP